MVDHSKGKSGSLKEIIKTCPQDDHYLRELKIGKPLQKYNGSKLHVRTTFILKANCKRRKRMAMFYKMYKNPTYTHKQCTYPTYF